MNYSGQDAVLEIGAQSDFSTIVAPTQKLEFTSENLKLNKKPVSSNALVGGITVNRVDYMSQMIDGGAQGIVHPDNIGLLLSAAFGAESAVSAVGSGVYTHQFSCLAGGPTNSLPKLTITVDRKAAIFGYVGCKIDTLNLSATLDDYLRYGITIVGRHEASDTLETLSQSALRPLQFSDGLATFDGSTSYDVSDFKFDLNNNVEKNRFAMDGTNYMQEPEAQGREIMMTLEVMLSADTNTIRENTYKAGASMDIVVTFTSTEAIAGAEYYTLTLTMNNAYLMDDPSFQIAGPERIKGTFNLKATDNGTDEPIIITLKDAKGTKYIT
jgi:hypothetical protein